MIFQDLIYLGCQWHSTYGWTLSGRLRSRAGTSLPCVLGWIVCLDSILVDGNKEVNA